MTLVRPRITDYFGISQAQAELDFAIPFFDEDLPLYVDPFLLWKSPSQQDQALHTSVINAFNHLNYLLRHSRDADAREILVALSECFEVGLGLSTKRRGVRIGPRTADEILSLFREIDFYKQNGFTHFEEVQLYVDDISKDRVSDICCSLLKSFLIDYTIDCCNSLRIPLEKVCLDTLYDYQSNSIRTGVPTELPVNPDTREPIIFVPKRWLRFGPWIAFGHAESATAGDAKEHR